MLGMELLADTNGISPGAMLKAAGILISVVAILVGWIIMRGMRGSAMKKWAKSKGLQINKDAITGVLEGRRINVTLGATRVNKEQMQFDGACTLQVRAQLPAGLRILAQNPMMAGMHFPQDTDFSKAVGVTADDQGQAQTFLDDPSLRQAIRYFLSVTKGMQVISNSVNASVSGVVAIGGDPSHVMDTPLRRCAQLAGVLEARARGEPIELDEIPGLRAGGGLAKGGPVKARNLPTPRRPNA